MALSAVEAEIWSGTRFGAVGLVEPLAHGRARFEFHTRATMASYVNAEDDFGPGGVVERLRAMWGIGALSRVPLGSEGAELFAGLPGDSQSVGPDEEKTLRELGRRVDAIFAAGEPDAVRDDRLARIESVAEVLGTISAALDIRDVFGQLAAIARRVIPHDFATIFTVSPDRERVRIHALSLPPGESLPEESPNPYAYALTDGLNWAVHHDLLEHPLERTRPAASLGIRSSIRIPLRQDEGTRITHSLNFSSRQPRQYTAADVPIARRIADYVSLAVSHQRLADEARDGAALRARTANAALVDELLTKLSGSGGLSDVFDEIAGVAGRALPHEILALAVPVDPSRAKVYARSPGAARQVPDEIELPADVHPDTWEYDLRDDVQARSGSRDAHAVRLGCRSVLRLPIRIDGKFAAALAFLSTEPSVYSAADLPVARRIADRIALVLARDRGAAATRRADEASARAAQLEARVRALTEELDARNGYRRVIGGSVPWKQVVTQAAQVAPTDTTVLLLGESGTGKEVVARLIHRASSRKDGGFVALNCAALPEQLLEAELFGYERGAFTGATQSKPGQLEQASGGTLFLDEVGEMSPQVQAKFLRVLQEREFQRLGGTRILKTDTRVVAATNRDLQLAMSHGQFREDLFYRLNVFAIRLPPLRERPDDVLPLSEAFLTEYAQSLGRPPSGISKDARRQLMEYHWPGNVRELRNILERAAILCDGGLITSEHLAFAIVPEPRPSPAEPPVAAASSPPASPSVPAPPLGDLAAVERTMIEQALQTARFNKSKAAAALGLTRAQLYVRMRKHGLE